MFNPRLNLVFGLCMASVFPRMLNPSSRPTRATVMWDVSPEDLEQQDIGTWRQCFYGPCPPEELQTSTQLGITLGSLEVACSALHLLLSSILLVHHLCRKAKRRPREEVDHIPSASPGTCCCQDDHSWKNKLMCWIKENPELMSAYVRYVSYLHHRYPQEDILQKQEKEKMREDLEEEKIYFFFY